MEVSALAALGTALGVYFYSRSNPGGEEARVPDDTHVNFHSAPQSLWDELYFLAEGLRYTYGETLGRWRTADLLIGLVSTCRLLLGLLGLVRGWEGGGAKREVPGDVTFLSLNKP